MSIEDDLPYLLGTLHFCLSITVRPETLLILEIFGLVLLGKTCLQKLYEAETHGLVLDVIMGKFENAVRYLIFDPLL